jgi:aminopeptidase N
VFCRLILDSLSHTPLRHTHTNIQKQAILAATEAIVEGQTPQALASSTIAAFRAVLQAGLDKDSPVDRSLLAYALSLPEELTLLGEMAVMRPVALHAAREHVRRALAQALAPKLEAVYAALDVAPPVFEATPQEIGRRRLKNVCLSYLSTAKDEAAAARALAAFRKANCMTDSLAALACLASLPGPAKDEALAAFYTKANGDPLVLNKWFSIQALADLPDAIDRVVALTQHKVRALCAFGVGWGLSDVLSGWVGSVDVLISLYHNINSRLIGLDWMN